VLLRVNLHYSNGWDSMDERLVKQEEDAQLAVARKPKATNKKSNKPKASIASEASGSLDSKEGPTRPESEKVNVHIFLSCSKDAFEKAGDLPVRVFDRHGLHGGIYATSSEQSGENLLAELAPMPGIPVIQVKHQLK
jgi:hypothetical protein